MNHSAKSLDFGYFESRFEIKVRKFPGVHTGDPGPGRVLTDLLQHGVQPRREEVQQDRGLQDQLGDGRRLRGAGQD